MKKKTIAGLALLAAGLVLAAGLLRMRSRIAPGFNGSRVSHDGEFAMEYETLNMTETCSFDLCAGDMIDVRVVSERGSVSAVIAAEGKEPIYRGTDMQTSAFQVVIPEDETYTISVTGDGARGSVRFEIRSPDSLGG